MYRLPVVVSTIATAGKAREGWDRSAMLQHTGLGNSLTHVMCEIRSDLGQSPRVPRRNKEPSTLPISREFKPPAPIASATGAFSCIMVCSYDCHILFL